jgi:chromosomal replication initiator protein
MTDDVSISNRIEEKWDEIKQIVRKECCLTNISYGTWIEPLEFLRYTDGVAYVLLPQNNAMAMDYVKNRFYSFFIEAMAAAAELDGLIDELSVEFTFDAEEVKARNEEKMSEEKLAQLRASLKPKFTFESFVVGGSNRFAYSAAVAVAEDPGAIYNPLFLYGGPGLGKTHLLQAIGNYICRTAPEQKVLYVTSEDFTNEVIDHVMKGQTDELHEKYRTVDVLLIDDVQFIIGKKATQLEFFHTFNTLYQDGKQIVLSSDRHPKEIEALDERFRSRFEMGLTSDIQKPDYETRMAILRKLHEGRILDIDDSVFEYIANGVVSNVRELEGAYTKVVAYSRLNKLEHIGEEEAKLALRDDIEVGRARNIPPSVIISTVAEQYNVSVDLLKSKKRSNDIVLPRQLAMYLIREYTDTTLAGIGKELGGRDHSTVKNSIERITDMLSTDEDVNQKIDVICMKLNLNKKE